MAVGRCNVLLHIPVRDQAQNARQSVSGRENPAPLIAELWGDRDRDPNEEEDSEIQIQHNISRGFKYLLENISVFYLLN